jgi:hypothetical protein
MRHRPRAARNRPRTTRNRPRSTHRAQGSTHRASHIARHALVERSPHPHDILGTSSRSFENQRPRRECAPIQVQHPLSSFSSRCEEYALFPHSAASRSSWISKGVTRVVHQGRPELRS